MQSKRNSHNLGAFGADFTWDNLGGDASRVLDLVTIIGSSVQQRSSG